jgi:prepilin-type N-terminal cleavage/methylation domain-containing protein
MKPSGNISKRAFTLVELLVVMAIIGILVTVTMGIYGSVKRKGVEFRLRTELAAIELALEMYKAKEGNYPFSPSWGVYVYPSPNWGGLSPNDHLKISNSTNEVNELYLHLVTYPLTKWKKPFLPDVKEDFHLGGVLLAPVLDVRGDAPFVKWYYNSFNPKYNEQSYDLWVEYGDLGKDKGNPSDDVVKVISNWNN